MERLTEDWIKDVCVEMKPIVEKGRKEFFKKQNSRPQVKKWKKKYDKLRLERIKSCVISVEEQELIRLFYVDCPEGYEVDHIIPLSKGGRHSLDNLQWLPKAYHRWKHTSILINLENPPHCLVTERTA